MGIEPTTSAVTGRRSNRLSHRAIKIMSILRSYLLRTISLSHIFYFQVLDVPSKHHTKPFSHFAFFGQSLDRLVQVSSIRYRTSTSCLSTSSSSRGLTSLRYGISHLEGGFTLRCLQRLSLPDLATLLCTWQYNRYTSGPSIPVLSY